MDGFESIFTDILGVFSNHAILVDFETNFTDFLGEISLKKESLPFDSLVTCVYSK